MNTLLNTPKNIKAIVGLGNPGAEFVHTRHNIGFLVVDHLASLHHAVWKTKERVMYTTITIGSSSILLIKPQTFMNSSGDALFFLQKQGIKKDEMVVVHDELEKAFGKVAFRFGGSHKGHNGLRSLIDRCGQDFWKLYIGIDRPEDKTQVSSYVLGKFTEGAHAVEAVIEKASMLLEATIEAF